MYQIELMGSYTAVSTYRDENITQTTKRADPVPALCRTLITRGADPRARVRVTRRETPIWSKDRALGDWAGIDITEEDRDGFRVRTVPLQKISPQAD